MRWSSRRYLALYRRVPTFKSRSTARRDRPCVGMACHCRPCLAHAWRCRPCPAQPGIPGHAGHAQRLPRMPGHAHAGERPPCRPWPAMAGHAGEACAFPAMLAETGRCAAHAMPCWQARAMLARLWPGHDMGSFGFRQARLWEVSGLAKPRRGDLWDWPGHAVGSLGFGQATAWEVWGVARPRYGNFWLLPGPPTIKSRNSSAMCFCFT